jgi:hypothetical protein
MAPPAFDGEKTPPTTAELAAMLGPAYPVWKELRDGLGLMCEPSSQEWGFAKSTGWGLRVKRGSRIIAYLAPRDGHVLASFALGDRAVAAAQASDLPDPILTLIRGARRYAEGTGVRVEVTGADDVRAVLTLAAVKIAH